MNMVLLKTRNHRFALFNRLGILFNYFFVLFVKRTLLIPRHIHTLFHLGFSPPITLVEFLPLRFQLRFLSITELFVKVAENVAGGRLLVFI